MYSRAVLARFRERVGYDEAPGVAGGFSVVVGDTGLEPMTSSV